MKKVFFPLLLVFALLLSACGTANPSEPDPSASPSPAELSLSLSDGITLVSIEAYSGAFVEDGSDEQVSDIMSVTVRNDGDQPIQYATLVVTVDSVDYNFELSTLPVGAEAKLLEMNKSAMPTLGEVTATVTACAFFTNEPTMCEELFEVDAQDGAITVTNISDKDFGSIYVYYKSCSDDLFLGGITYRVNVPELKSGDSYSCYAGHFSANGSRLMFINYAQ